MEGAISRAAVATIVTTVAVVAVAFLVAVAPWSTDDFGYSLDGFNGSVWGLGARAAADDPIGSHLGGVDPSGRAYANHPPLTVWAAGLGSAVSGDRPGAVRAPALVASVLALAVLALLLADAGLRPEAVAAGVALAGTTGMFLTYGAMLDTPVVGLPLGLAAVAAAQRVGQGRPPPRWALVLVGALAALAGWQAALAAGLAALVALAAGRGRTAPGGGDEADGPPPRRGAIALGAGVGLGATATLAWIAWVYDGDLGRLFDQAGVRTGLRRTGGDAGWFRVMDAHLTDLYGPPAVLLLIAAAVVVAVVAPTGLRRAAAVLATVVVGYTVLFRNGAAVHDYWTYWGVALVGVGAAVVVDLVLTRTPLGRLPRLVAVVLVAAAVVPLAVVGTGRQTRAETRIRNGLDLLPVLGEVPPAEDPHDLVIAVYNAPGELPWAEHLLHGRAVEADDEPSLRRLPPDLPVLVVLRAPPSPRLRTVALARNQRFALITAGDLADHLAG